MIGKCICMMSTRDKLIYKTEELCREGVTNFEKRFKLWFGSKTFCTFETSRTTCRMVYGRKYIYTIILFLFHKNSLKLAHDTCLAAFVLDLYLSWLKQFIFFSLFAKSYLQKLLFLLITCCVQTFWKITTACLNKQTNIFA